jgi:hypothetical protein
MLNDRPKQTLNWSPSISFPIILFRTIPICVTVTILLCVGEPDIIDGIIGVLNALADFLKQL